MQHRHPHRLSPLRASFLTPPLFRQPRLETCTRFAPQEICATLCSLMTCGRGARAANTVVTLVTSQSGSRPRQSALSPSACVIACVLITSTRTVREEGGRAIACASMACHSLAEAFAYRYLQSLTSRQALPAEMPVASPFASLPMELRLEPFSELNYSLHIVLSRRCCASGPPRLAGDYRYSGSDLDLRRFLLLSKLRLDCQLEATTQKSFPVNLI